MAAIDRIFLKRITETPSVGTACGMMVALLTERFGTQYRRTLVNDGFCLFQHSSGTPDQIKAVFIAHIDEIGGTTYGKREDSGFDCRFWGTDDPELYADAKLVGFDYLTTEREYVFPITSRIVRNDDGLARLAVDSEQIRPYRTGFTFQQETTLDHQYVHAKAIDPRATVYSVCEAIRWLSNPAIAAIFVMAEECAMDMARKAVTYLDRNCPNLGLIVNADVPSVKNLGDASLDLPAIRIFEGRNFIDPSFGIQVASRLIDDGVACHLSAAKSGSQTLLFAPLAPTLSIALPGEDIHTSCGKMSLLGIERCTDLLVAIGERYLSDSL